MFNIKNLAILLIMTTSKAESVMTRLLDDMQVYYDGAGAQYNRKYLNELRQCFLKFDDDLLL